MEHERIWIPLLLTVLAGLSTGLGSIVILFVKDLKKIYLHFFLGMSAGVMIYVSLVELLQRSIKQIGFLASNISFFIGIVFILIIDFLIPHEYIEEQAMIGKDNTKLLNSGILTAIGIAIHNFPEGLAVFFSSYGDIKLGIPLALAIAIHNIPEGIAISMPIYYATNSKNKAFWYSLGAGLAEPAGAILGLFLFMPFISPYTLSLFLAFVAGIMVFISFDELLPLCYECKTSHVSIAGILVGMLIMTFSLWILGV